jgi:hypothetical protein
MMTRWFNTAGPCRPEKHYMLSPLARLPKVERLVEQESYFVIHAPRQIGKTTAIMGLAQQLTDSGKYTSVVLSVEVGAPYSQDITGAEVAILGSWQDDISVSLPAELQPPPWSSAAPGQKIKAALKTWAQASSRPLVILIDEGEALLKSASYSEIAPHLVMMAFLHRVVNGGGTLSREYAIGRVGASLSVSSYRMDLCLKYGEMILGIELKVWRTRASDPLTKGLPQLEEYLDRLKQPSGWLVIFDTRKNAPSIEERLAIEDAVTASGRSVKVIRV